MHMLSERVPKLITLKNNSSTPFFFLAGGIGARQGGRHFLSVVICLEQHASLIGIFS